MGILLKAGDPKGDAATVEGEEAVRDKFIYRDPDLALQWVTEPAATSRTRTIRSRPGRSDGP